MNTRPQYIEKYRISFLYFISSRHAALFHRLAHKSYSLNLLSTHTTELKKKKNRRAIQSIVCSFLRIIPSILVGREHSVVYYRLSVVKNSRRCRPPLFIIMTRFTRYYKNTIKNSKILEPIQLDLPAERGGPAISKNCIFFFFCLSV